MTQTAHLKLPFLASGQAQKHVTVNESLLRLDALVQLAPVSAATLVQPPAPVDGDIYILPAGKSGAAWGPMAVGALAYWRDGAWEEIAPRHGWRAYVRDAGTFLAFDGAAWAEVAPAAAPAFRVLAASAIAASVTGATAETVLATVAVPPGAMGANGVLRITAQWSLTNSANVKTLRTRFSGTAGPAFHASNLTANTSFRHQVEIHNRGVANAQVGMSASVAFGGSGGAAITAAIDTSLAQDIVFSAQLANAGETATLESYLVELYSAP